MFSRICRLHVLYRILCFLCMCHSVVKGEGLFWHISDIHLDQNYSRTGNPSDLCHDDNITHPDNGLYGNFLCDSPEYLVNITVQSMKALQPAPDFILWTGDNLPHTRKFDADYEIIFEALNNVTNLLTSAFPGIPVFPCIGNHDTFPPNILRPTNFSNSIYEGYLKKGGWNELLVQQAQSTFLTGGFYSQLIKPGLRVISLNTILWYDPNTFTSDLRDPANQFSWLEDVLQNCSISSEKVYIIGHVPPGFYNRVKYGERSTPTYHLQYLEAYLKILKKYSEIILAQMFGHLHIDMFQLFQCNTGSFKSSSLLAPSITPWYYIDTDNLSLPVNPAIRLVHFSPSDGSLQDYDEFFLNLTRVNSINKTEESSNLYELLYTFTKSYGVPDLSTQSLVQVYERLKKDTDLFNTFFEHSTSGKLSVPCDNNCKIAQLCSMACTSKQEYDSCMENSSTQLCDNTSGDGSCKNHLVLVYTFIIVFSLIFIFLGCFVFYRNRRRSLDESKYELFPN